MREFNDLYAVLGVAPTAPHEVVRAAYRVMAKMHHPDVNEKSAVNSYKMASINHAYDVLSCPLRRREYDQRVERAQMQFVTKGVFNYQNSHANFNTLAEVLTTYDRRGKLHAHF